jgi:hypothetical protein
VPICNHEWLTTHWDKVLCEQEWIGKFKHQVHCLQRCQNCKGTRRAWYGIDHQDRELKTTMYVIKPKKFEYWDRYVKNYTLISSQGVLAVKAQKYWDGIPLHFMTVQAVQA